MPVRFVLDTNCIVAAICGWHDHNRSAVNEIERRLGRGEQMAVAAHALTEAYSVLTRFPAPHRLAPADAWELLRANFAEGATIAVLTPSQHVALIRRLAAAGVSGGRTYDALIAECAVKVGAAALLTFNPRHFDPAPQGLSVVVPA